MVQIWPLFWVCKSSNISALESEASLTANQTLCCWMPFYHRPICYVLAIRARHVYYSVSEHFSKASAAAAAHMKIEKLRIICIKMVIKMVDETELQRQAWRSLLCVYTMNEYSRENKLTHHHAHHWAHHMRRYEKINLHQSKHRNSKWWPLLEPVADPGGGGGDRPL